LMQFLPLAIGGVAVFMVINMMNQQRR
jgi:hypothetical protein